MTAIEIATESAFRSNLIIYALQFIGVVAISLLGYFVYRLWTNR